MVSLSLLYHRAVAFFFLALYLGDTTAFKFGSRIKDTTASSKLSQPKNLTTLLRPAPDDRSRVYVQALELLSSIQAAPSCHRLATSTLLDSCQSFKGPKHDSEVIIDGTRSLYAAQLAICEIESANSIVPPLYAPIFPNAQLSHCLQALESRPQWWISYSNSRQNAMVICQAARTDIEKDELIELHKSSIQINRDADAALARAVEDSLETLRRQQEEFALVKRAFQEDLLRDLELAAKRAQSFLGKLMTGLDAGVQTFLTRVTSATRSFEADVIGLRANIDSVNAKSQNLESSVGKVFQKAAEGTAELASIQTRYLDETNELAKRLRSSMEQMREIDVYNLVIMMQQMHGQMQTTNDLAVSVSTRQDNVDHQMTRLGQVMTSLQAHAQALQDAQLRQEVIQTRLHNAMEIGLNASLGRLFLIEGSTTKLQGALQDASQSIAQIASLAWIMSSFWKWSSLAIISSLGIFAAFSRSASFARYITAAIGLVAIIKCSSALLLEVVNRRSPLPVNLPFDLLVACGFVIGVVISIVYMRHLKKPSIVKQSLPVDSNMQHLGQTSSGRKLHSTWRI